MIDAVLLYQIADNCFKPKQIEASEQYNFCDEFEQNILNMF